MGEVEEMLEVVDAKNFKAIAEPLFQQLSKSIVSPHFQVSLSRSLLKNSLRLALLKRSETVQGVKYFIETFASINMGVETTLSHVAD